MPYELTTFRHILQGDLSPLYFPLETSEQTSWYNHLSEAPAFCTKQIHVQFNQLDSALPGIHSLQVQLLDQYPLPIFVAQDHTVHPSEVGDGEALLSYVLDHLSLAREAVIEWYHWQDERAQLHLELFAQYPLEALSPEERRYYFYQCLLTEQVAMIQEHMVQYVHQTPSRKKVSKYVQDHQRDLLTYASQVMQCLDEEQPQVYTLSDAYSLPDVYKLIFLSLEELTDYLEQQFGQYLDAEAPVPYHHQVVYSSRLSQPLPALQASLLDSAIDSELTAIVEEILDSIRQLPAPKATHPQLRYYQTLIQTLETFVEQDDLNSESLTATLFRINFNHPAFVTWSTTQLKDQLASQVTVEERLQTLYHYRKFCKQLPAVSSLSYYSEQPSVQEQALGWINEEIAYQQEVGDVPAPPPGESLSRIKTNLSVPELSLLIRTLFEVKALPDQKKANVYRHFSLIFDSIGKEEISPNTLRNHQYQPSRHTITELKSKVIAMMNFLNSL